MERAKRRQTYVLQQMADKGFITQKEADEAKARPIVLRLAGTSGPIPSRPTSSRRCARNSKARYGAKALYQNGLTVQTALDLKLQDAANRALDEGIRRVDHIHGFRKPKRNVLDEQHTIEGFKHPRWDRPFAVDDVVPAVVTDVDAATIHLRAGDYTLDHRQEGLRVDAQDRAGAARAAAAISSRRSC